MVKVLAMSTNVRTLPLPIGVYPSLTWDGSKDVLLDEKLLLIYPMVVVVVITTARFSSM